MIIRTHNLLHVSHCPCSMILQAICCTEHPPLFPNCAMLLKHPGSRHGLLAAHIHIQYEASTILPKMLCCISRLLKIINFPTSIVKTLCFHLGPILSASLTTSENSAECREHACHGTGLSLSQYYCIRFCPGTF
jgi:hypothetical protein